MDKIIVPSFVDNHQMSPKVEEMLSVQKRLLRKEKAKERLKKLENLRLERLDNLD